MAFKGHIRPLQLQIITWWVIWEPHDTYCQFLVQKWGAHVHREPLSITPSMHRFIPIPPSPIETESPRGKGKPWRFPPPPLQMSAGVRNSGLLCVVFFFFLEDSLRRKIKFSPSRFWECLGRVIRKVLHLSKADRDHWVSTLMSCGNR